MRSDLASSHVGVRLALLESSRSLSYHNDPKQLLSAIWVVRHFLYRMACVLQLDLVRQDMGEMRGWLVRLMFATIRSMSIPNDDDRTTVLSSHETLSHMAGQ